MRMRFLSDASILFSNEAMTHQLKPGLLLMYIVFRCRHASSSNSLYQESATVIPWYVNMSSIFILVV